MSNLLAMTIGDTRPFIDRNYRDITQPGQWLRETFRNADEAHARSVHYGIEWQGVETQGVYRRYIADDGDGMDQPDLVKFMLTYGGGGKPIGTEHENFGIGAKVTLLPWNSAGLVVISYKDGDGFAMLMRAHERDYGAVPWDALDSEGEVVPAAVIDPDGASLGEFGIADLGAVWKQVPFWADKDEPPQHGTIFLLLGPDREYDTILGDPSRPAESATHVQALFLNSRLWEVSDAQRVTIDVPVSPDKNTWTKRDPGDVKSGPGTGGFTRRAVAGAKFYIDRDGRFPVTNGSVDLEDGTVAHWWLRTESPERRPNPYGPRAGFVAVLYNDELYDVARSEDSKWRYRQFGVLAAEVMSRLFVVVEPPTDGPNGIYPTGGRDRLLRNGGRDLPFAEWGSIFHDQMPNEIADAIAMAMPKEFMGDSSWKERFAERFWDRLHETRLRLRKDGQNTAGAGTQTAPRVAAPGGQSDGADGPRRLPRIPAIRERTAANVISDLAGSKRARSTEVESTIPSWMPVGATEFDHSYSLASWDPETANSDGSRGCVYLNKEHVAVASLVEAMANAYSVSRKDIASWQQVEVAVWETLGQSLVAKVVHVQSVLRREVEVTRLRAEYLSDASLTTAGLGMIWEQQALQPKLGGILGRKKVGS